jgi:hypothetical protein
MGKYGDAAEIAAALLAQQKTLEPRAAWTQAVEQVFPASASSRAKGCPRDSFLGLCELGAVKGVAPGPYTRSVKNKTYVTRALGALRRDPGLAEDLNHLWRVATAGADTRANRQMDVVATLWRKGLLD